MKKHKGKTRKWKAGSKRSRNHLQVLKQEECGNGIFMSMNLSPEVVKGINRRERPGAI